MPVTLYNSGKLPVIHQTQLIILQRTHLKMGLGRIKWLYFPWSSHSMMLENLRKIEVMTIGILRLGEELKT